MSEDKRWALIEDIIAGVTHGSSTSAHDQWSIERRDDGTVLEVDLGDADVVYVVTVSAVERVD